MPASEPERPANAPPDPLIEINSLAEVKIVSESEKVSPLAAEDVKLKSTEEQFAKKQVVLPIGIDPGQGDKGIGGGGGKPFPSTKANPPEKVSVGVHPPRPHVKCKL